ncbi:MAG: transglycosylase SLT domain-containing protein [Streptosporangiaceae bacterium]
MGLATATPGGPGATSALGTALTAHGGTGTLPLAQISLDQRVSSRAGAGGSAAPQLAAGVSPVTATGRAIMASGLAAALAAPARSGSSRPADSGNQAPSSHPDKAAARRDSSARPDGHAKLDTSAKHVHRAAPAHKAKAAHRTHVASARHTGPCAASTLHWWICAAEHALEQHGVSRGLLSTSAADIVVQHESGANPHAYNGWDSNAAAGHPSEGIAQVIGPTFHAYALPGHHNIWNPVDNMIAAFRYAISRYGSMNNIPGVVNVRQGGSYVGY